MKAKWIFLSMLSLGVLGLFAQGSIEGNLKDEKGEALSFANIIIYQNNELVVGTSADDEGFYFVDNLKEGKYEVVISYMGNKSEPQLITIKDRETFVYNTEVISGTTIGPIEVGPPKNYVKLMDKFEPQVKITTKEVFTETGIKTLSDALNLGASTTQDSEGNTSFRGSRPGQGAYYVDGMRIAGPLGIPTASINRMKVYNGGVPARYGNTTSAVIVIETNSVFDYFD